jgi:Zn finger protein HypA/HybF involved in hydrogenase expression
MPRDPKTAECWNCNRKYDRVYPAHGGILGRCNGCDSDQWIITKDEMIKMNKKKKKGGKRAKTI